MTLLPVLALSKHDLLSCAHGRLPPKSTHKYLSTPSHQITPDPHCPTTTAYLPTILSLHLAAEIQLQIALGACSPLSPLAEYILEPSLDVSGPLQVVRKPRL